MPEITHHQFQELQDRIYALQQLVLAHVVATDAFDRTIGDDTLEIARKQASACRADRPFVAVQLGGLAEAIEQVRQA